MAGADIQRTPLPSVSFMASIEHNGQINTGVKKKIFFKLLSSWGELSFIVPFSLGVAGTSQSILQKWSFQIANVARVLHEATTGSS